MDDHTLLEQFEGCQLPFRHWTHRAHVRVAYLYLRALPFDEALARLRQGIQAYNSAHRVPEGPTSGYNETTTRAFMRLVAATMAAYGDVFPTEDSESFCDTHPQLLSKHVLRLFYSPQQRMRPEAKLEFVEPDLAQLPLAPSPIRGRETQGGEGLTTAAFELESLLEDQRRAGAAWLPFLESPHLQVGLYVVKRDDREDHDPHPWDEVYYVLRGRGVLRVEGEDTPITPGSILFVPQHREHHFHGIEEELTLLVFFAKS